MTTSQVVDITQSIDATALHINELVRLERALLDTFPDPTARIRTELWHDDRRYVPPSTLAAFVAEGSAPQSVTKVTMLLTDADADGLFNNYFDLVIGPVSQFHLYARNAAWGTIILEELDRIFTAKRHVAKFILGSLAFVSATLAASLLIKLLLAFLGYLTAQSVDDAEAIANDRTWIIALIALPLVSVPAYTLARVAISPPRVAINDKAAIAWSQWMTIAAAGIGMLLAIFAWL
jgi:hypothetical protein